MKWPLTLMKEDEMDGYRYFDSHVRQLPRKLDGTIDTLSPGFQDNDVDAFRHAYSSVVVLKQTKTGANEFFFDFETSTGMTRAEFVEAIANGQYPGYESRTINGIMVPVAKRDSSNANYLG